MSETIFRNWKRLQNDEKYFLFYLKSSFSSEDIEVFFFTFWSCLLHLFRKNDKVNFKFYEVTAWLSNIVRHILSNISRSKDNQTMKFGQLMEYKMRKVFLEKSYAKRDGETGPRPFSEELKLSISLDQ